MNNLNDIFFAPAANQDLTYEQILEDVQRYFAENHAATIAEAGDGNTDRASSLLKELMVQYIVKRKYAIKGLTTEELCEKLYEDMAGYSFLKKWIYKPGIEEVNINAYNDIEVIEAGGRSVKIPDKFSSPQHAIDVVRRMLNACGMVIDDTMPSVIGFLDKNVRISVDKTPIVDPEVGINASIRIVNQQTVSAQKLLDSGSATAEMLHFLTACIRYGVSVCIAGATGSGKTTIMAWLLSQVPDNRRLITIEEGSREFDLVKRDEKGNILNSVVHLLTRPSENPSLNINQDFLLERVLRKHPDVIGVGEMRSAAESLWLCKAASTYKNDGRAQFSTYAKTVVKNGLLSYCRAICNRKKKFSRLIIGEHGELAADGEALESRPDAFDTQVSLIETLSLLDACKKDYDGVTRLGIEALALKLQGMRVTDIAELYQVPPSHVGAWISRSTAKLRRDSKFLKSLL